MQVQPVRIGVIPARAQSSRFPYKVLAPILGVPLIQRVWEASRKSSLLHRVVIATDCERVAQAARGFGAEVILTPSSLPSGSDRVFHAMKGLPADIVVNLQGDEPLLEGAAIDALIQALEESGPSIGMATLAVPHQGRQEQQSPHVVKLRLGERGIVKDFSREAFSSSEEFFKHIGVYAFWRQTLERFCQLPPSERERNESLEQLRALENGIAIRAVIWPRDTIAVDTPDDIVRVERALRARKDFFQDENVKG